MTEPQEPRTEARCAATKPGLTPGHVRRCPRQAHYGEWCFQHAHSVGGWLLVPPSELESASAAIESLQSRLDRATADLAEARQAGDAGDDAVRLPDFSDAIVRHCGAPNGWHSGRCITVLDEIAAAQSEGSTR